MIYLPNSVSMIKVARIETMSETQINYSVFDCGNELKETPSTSNKTLNTDTSSDTEKDHVTFKKRTLYVIAILAATVLIFNGLFMFLITSRKQDCNSSLPEETSMEEKQRGNIPTTGTSITDCDESSPCETGTTGIYPHPRECQLYYNCSLPSEEFKPWLGDHVMECMYPDNFQEKTSKCEFENVNCGQRKELGHACEYRNNICKQEYCRSCRSDFWCIDSSHGNCGPTVSGLMRRLNCPSDEHGNVMIVDASLCSTL